jgi:hypothetical protein
MTLFEADVSVDQTVYTTSNGANHMLTYSGHLPGPSPHRKPRDRGRPAVLSPHRYSGRRTREEQLLVQHQNNLEARHDIRGCCLDLQHKRFDAG